MEIAALKGWGSLWKHKMLDMVYPSPRQPYVPLRFRASTRLGFPQKHISLLRRGKEEKKGKNFSALGEIKWKKTFNCQS